MITLRQTHPCDGLLTQSHRYDSASSVVAPAPATGATRQLGE